MTEGRLRWGPSPLALAVATCAAAALVAAIIARRWELVAFAAPFVGVLVSVGWQRPSDLVRVGAEPETVRCFEGESVAVTIEGSSPAGDAAIMVEPMPTAGLEVLATAGEKADAVSLDLSAARWGRYRLPVQVTALASSGLLTGSTHTSDGEAHVYPLAAPQATEIPRTDLPDRLGTHLTRHHGPGVEYADIRAYVPGDQLRTVNWAVSARRGRLHVTERLTDRSADIIVLIDNYPQASGPASEAIERCARGATQVVQSALQRGDRAGIVCLGGGRPRWLSADIGRRQFYRVIDTVLGAGSEFVTTEGTLAPRPAVPVGAIVIAFSTLLDTQFALALIDLRRRGHTVVAVDVLDGSPFTTELEPMVARMWHLGRAAMYRDMGTVGVDVCTWRAENTLDQAMRLVPDRAPRQRRRR